MDQGKPSWWRREPGEPPREAESDAAGPSTDSDATAPPAAPAAPPARDESATEDAGPPPGFDPEVDQLRRVRQALREWRDGEDDYHRNRATESPAGDAAGAGGWAAGAPGGSAVENGAREAVTPGADASAGAATTPAAGAPEDGVREPGAATVAGTPARAPEAGVFGDAPGEDAPRTAGGVSVAAAAAEAGVPADAVDAGTADAQAPDAGAAAGVAGDAGAPAAGAPRGGASRWATGADASAGRGSDAAGKAAAGASGTAAQAPEAGAAGGEGTEDGGSEARPWDVGVTPYPGAEGEGSPGGRQIPAAVSAVAGARAGRAALPQRDPEGTAAESPAAAADGPQDAVEPAQTPAPAAADSSAVSAPEEPATAPNDAQGEESAAGGPVSAADGPRDAVGPARSRAGRGETTDAPARSGSAGGYGVGSGRPAGDEDAVEPRSASPVVEDDDTRQLAVVSESGPPPSADVPGPRPSAPGDPARGGAAPAEPAAAAAGAAEGDVQHRPAPGDARPAGPGPQGGPYQPYGPGPQTPAHGAPAGPGGPGAQAPAPGTSAPGGPAHGAPGAPAAAGGPGAQTPASGPSAPGGPGHGAHGAPAGPGGPGAQTPASGPSAPGGPGHGAHGALAGPGGPGAQTPAPGASAPGGPAHGAPAAAGPVGPHAPHPQGWPAQGGAAPQWQRYDPWAPPQGVPGRERRKGRGAVLVGAVLIALVAGGIGGAIGSYVERNGTPGQVELDQSPADDIAGDGERPPGSVAGIARSALPGVVTLRVSGVAEQSTGTGFVLDRRGHILTNNHVVQPAEDGGEITVTFSGGESKTAEVVGGDAGYDLAVVRVKGVSGLKPLPLGNSRSVAVGDPVVAIGAPYDLPNTVTSGIISAKERPITAGGEEGDGSDISYVNALQTDAPINPGNSGGPLLDLKGRVIGINSAIRAADDGSGAPRTEQGGSIGLGFAIPVNKGKEVAEELINTGKATHPVIGVTLNMQYAGDGAEVGTSEEEGNPPVTPGGPADRAGIEPGDVITGVDGEAVHNGEELIVKIRSHRPGDELSLTIDRDGEELTVDVTLGEGEPTD